MTSSQAARAGQVGVAPQVESTAQADGTAQLATPLHVVTYDGLPAAAGGAHSLRVKRPADARQRVQSFLDVCTVPAGRISWTFQLSTNGGAEEAERLRAFASGRLGGHRRSSQTGTEWGVRDDAVDDVLAELAAVGPLTTKYGASLATLAQSLDVHLLDASSGAPWPDLAPGRFGGFSVDGYGRLLGASGVRATYGTSGSSLSLWLNLPADERLAPAARHLQDHLPVKLSAKHWRRWVPTRSGDGFRSTNIPSPLL